MTTNCRAIALTVLLPVLALSAWAQTDDTTSKKWEADIRKFEQADSVQPPPKGAILFVGSSSIRLWETLQKDFPGYHVINRGFGGSELGDALYFADRIILPYKPRTILVYAGDNDIANGKTPDQIFDTYKQLVQLIHQKLPKARIGYIAIKPSIARWNLIEKIKSTNELIQKYSGQDRLLMFIDVYTPMLGKDGNPRKELFAPDGLHLNREGYTLWKNVVGPALK